MSENVFKGVEIVGTSEQRQRNAEAECLCGLQVDNEFDLDCLLDRHLRSGGELGTQRLGHSRARPPMRELQMEQ